MKAILGLLALVACCLALTTASAYAGTEPLARDVEQAAISATSPPVQEARPIDPYIGLGELGTSAPLPVDCFNGNIACEEVPLGSPCWNGVCRCVAFGYCHKP